MYCTVSYNIIIKTRYQPVYQWQIPVKPDLFSAGLSPVAGHPFEPLVTSGASAGLLGSRVMSSLRSNIQPSGISSHSLHWRECLGFPFSAVPLPSNQAQTSYNPNNNSISSSRLRSPESMLPTHWNSRMTIPIPLICGKLVPNYYGSSWSRLCFSKYSWSLSVGSLKQPKYQSRMSLGRPPEAPLYPCPE